jgi:CRP-like cAMP-binding protein
MATVRAITDVRVARIEDAAAFLRAHPDFALDVARLLAERLTSAVSYVADLKRQFKGDSHLGMVDEVLDTLVNQQRRPFMPGSNREPDPTR